MRLSAFPPPFPPCVSPLPRSKVVRKNIARVNTVISQKQREALKEAYKGKVRMGHGAMGSPARNGSEQRSCRCSQQPHVQLAGR